MASVDALWQLAINDPHLMRLGHFLASTSGREGSEEQLEISFMEESWLSWVKIEQVMEPGFGKRPFVIISSSHLGLHSACPFFALKQEQVSIEEFWIQLSNFCIFDQEKKKVTCHHCNLYVCTQDCNGCDRGSESDFQSPRPALVISKSEHFSGYSLLSRLVLTGLVGRHLRRCPTRSLLRTLNNGRRQRREGA